MKLIKAIIALIVLAGVFVGGWLAHGYYQSNDGEMTPTDITLPGLTKQKSQDEQPKPDSDSSQTNTGATDITQAMNIALDEYGGKVIGVETNSYLGEPAWEVELRDSSEGRLEVKVSKQTGKILEVEHEED